MTVSKRPTSTAVTGPTFGYLDQTLTFTVQVNDTSGAGGTSPSFDEVATVTWSSTGGSGTFTPPAPCAVDSNGQCSVSYTPSDTGTHTIKAEYAGNDYYVASDPDGSTDVTVNKRPTSTAVTGPATPYVNQKVTITVTFSYDNGEPPNGFDVTAPNNIAWTVIKPDLTRKASSARQMTGPGSRP